MAEKIVIATRKSPLAMWQAEFVKAELEKVRLPLYLHYVLFFVSLWDFETDWFTIDFIY